MGQQIGRRVRRVEDGRFLTGAGQYVADLAQHAEGPRPLWLAIVRSQRGHALIRRVSTAPARTLRGVVAVYTAEDLPVLGRPLPDIFPIPGMEKRLPSPLATDRARYEGEAIAVVVARDEYAAADGAAAVEVEYNPLPVVEDPLRALEPAAPLVHDDVPGNKPGTTERGYGDVAGAFAEATVTVKRRLCVDRAAGAAIECRTVMAEPDGCGGIVVHTSTQNPHGLRRGLAAMLGLPTERVRVVAPDVGGGFGPKGRFYPEEVIAAAAAIHLDRPVVWQATREEDLLTTYQGRGSIVDAELAADGRGRLSGLRVRMVQDIGAYMATALVVPMNSAQHMLGPYHLPSVEIEITPVYTNKIPISPLRGGGREVGMFVIERMMDRLAAEMGLDPGEIRLRNALGPDEFPYDTGYPNRAGGTVVFDSGDYPSYLERAKDLIGYDRFRQTQGADRSRGRYRGVAVTLFLESTGGMAEGARAELLEDGRVRLRIGSPSTGQGHATSIAQLFAERLGLPLESVEYVSGDAGAGVEGTGTFGSRIAVAAGNAGAQAGTKLKEAILEAASHEIEAAPEDLDISDGSVEVRGAPGHGLTLPELAARLSAGGGLPPIETTFEATGGAAFAGGAHAAIVEVDVETGLVNVERYLVVHDCGTVINPNIVDGQVHGGVAEGIGEALGGDSVYDESGTLQTRTFQTYRIPMARDIPDVEVEHQHHPSPHNPEGIKGAGEGGTIGALATIARAVEDALEPFAIEVNGLPVRDEWIVHEIGKAVDG